MKLFVANVAFEATEADLLELFRQIGPVKRLHLATDRAGKSRGFAFLEYEDPLDATRAFDDIHGHEFKGRRLIVKEAVDGPRQR